MGRSADDCTILLSAIIQCSTVRRFAQPRSIVTAEPASPSRLAENMLAGAFSGNLHARPRATMQVPLCMMAACLSARRLCTRQLSASRHTRLVSFADLAKTVVRIGLPLGRDLRRAHPQELGPALIRSARRHAAGCSPAPITVERRRCLPLRLVADANTAYPRSTMRATRWSGSASHGG